MIAIGNGASSVPDIGLLLSALQGDTDNRILSTPSLMAAENKESVILVGQNVPFVTGQFLPETGTGQSPFQTIKREDLGTKLKLKPRIGLKNDITLEVWQEVSRIDQNATGLTDVVTVKREITTVISAKHGETVAIGGLRVEQEEMAISKVPFLGDIPGIGNLFRQETVNSVSRNLVIFLRPRLVSSEHQREHMLNVWKNDLGLDLYEYEEQKLMMSSPDPIGGRMQIETLRPKVRPTGN
jgi:general secretion pathway protein D